MAKISIVPWIAKKLKRCIGIVEDTDTASQAIASDKYVIWKGDVCKSTDDISEGDTLSSDNLSQVSNGIGNDLLEDVAANAQAIATLNSNIGTQAQTLSSFVIPITAKKSANVVVLSIEYTAAKEALTKNQSKLLGTLPEAYRPSGNVFTSCLLTSTNGDLVAYLRVTIEASGNITIYPSASIATSQSLFGSFAYCI